MAIKICLANQKGGVGKTATAQQLIAYLIRQGKKVLAIDLDAQWNLSLMFGLYSPDYECDGTMEGKTVYQLMKGKPIKDVIVRVGEVDFICGTVLLSNADGEFAGLSGYTKLKDSLSQIEKNYDFIIMDCPPTCGLITINALAASNGAIVPYKADSLTKAGVFQLSEIIEGVKKNFNSKLKVYGVLVTMYDKRATISKRAVLDAEEVAKVLKTKVFQTKIRQNSKMRELADAEKNIFEYAPTSPSAEDYKAFGEELMKLLKEIK